jgi:hypothetical protein
VKATDETEPDWPVVTTQSEEGKVTEIPYGVLSSAENEDASDHNTMLCVEIEIEDDGNKSANTTANGNVKRSFVPASVNV